MQKILSRRVWRSLKKHAVRYLALGALIILGMYMVIGMVGAADTIMLGVEQSGGKTCVEDGQFSVFVPLGEEEEAELEGKGVTIEKIFYMDYVQEDKSVLRLFQNREKIDLISLDEGTLPEGEDGIVLEKRYAEEKKIQTGDKIFVGGREFHVTGIGSIPDYDAPLKNLSDSSVSSDGFGVGFVNREAYETLREEGKSSKAEEFVYAYRLNGAVSHEKLKQNLQEYSVLPEKVSDKYFQDYWDGTAGKKDEFTDGIQELKDGSEELQEALEKLEGHNTELQKGAERILESYLSQAQEGLEGYGLTEELTADNFETVLKSLEKKTSSAVVRLSISSLRGKLGQIAAYRDGVEAYTKGVGKTAEGSKELADGMGELKKETDKFLKEYFDEDISNLTLFLKAEANPRIRASAEDQVINKVAGMIAGIIVMILFTYVISVFVIHGIERESGIIGALYALGVKRKELMAHYLVLPVVVTFLAGCIGTALGYSPLGVDVQLQDCYAYFSIPRMETAYSGYLLVYGIVMPPLIAVIVNCIVIRRRLSRPALQLMRNEQKGGSVSRLNLGNMGFVARFRIRQMLREARTSLTVLFGMFVCLLILMLTVDCYVMCTHISEDNKKDTKFEYMYTYKYPQKEVPEGGVEAFSKGLKKEVLGNDLDVNLLGIREDNPYFNVTLPEKANQVVISSAMAEKYGLSEGDKLVMTDEEEDRDYAFTIAGITQYSTSLYAFMDIDSMRELFDADDEYYNVIFSDRKLDIPSGQLYATTTKEEISRSSDVFVSMMMPMISMLTIVSALIFCVVMYLMMKVMIDRSSFHISLIKIFGYRKKEIRKLYLNGNFYVVAVGAAICIPLAKAVMDAMYPVMVSNIACGMNLHVTWQIYVGIYGAVILFYLLVNQLLVRRLDRMTPAEVLKNRE